MVIGLIQWRWQSFNVNNQGMYYICPSADSQALNKAVLHYLLPYFEKLFADVVLVNLTELI